MHKGYAFVQFANPFDARSACLGEDGRFISEQVIGKLQERKIENGADAAFRFTSVSRMGKDAAAFEAE